MTLRRAIVLSSAVVPMMLIGAPRAQARAEIPRISVVSAASPGESVEVELAHWPEGAVTASVCGDNARSGTPDCDLVSAQAAAVGADGATRFALPIVVPPTPCPCVVRVATSTSSVVKTAPIELGGVTSAPPSTGPAAAPSPDQLEVRAQVVDDSDWRHELLSAFGGSSSRRLVVTLRNRGATPLSALRLVAEVGRNPSDAQPIDPRQVRSIPPGGIRRVAVPFTVSAPSWGTYRVFGSIYGTEVPVKVHASTASDPWALEVLVILLLLLAAQVARRRERRLRAQRAELDDRPIQFPPSSLDVGNSDQERWNVAAYAHDGIVDPTPLPTRSRGACDAVQPDDARMRVRTG